MLQTLSDTIKVRCMPGTRRRIKKSMRDFKGRWDNESHFYRAAIFNFCNQLDAEKFDKDLRAAHEKRRGRR